MLEFETFDDVLDFAIANEQHAYDFYVDLANKAGNQAMREAFIEFANEEKVHKNRLVSIKNDKHIELSSSAVSDLKIADYTVQVKTSSDMTYQEALILAMKREKSAYKLYIHLARMAENENVKQTFLALAQEEAKHKLRFEIEYDEHILQEN